MSARYLEIEGARAGEYCFLVLCATLGMMIMAGGVDLITIFIGLETMAVSFYVLTGFIKPNRRSNEAAVKYFLLGAFSSTSSTALAASAYTTKIFKSRPPSPTSLGLTLAVSRPPDVQDRGRAFTWAPDA
jgi:NADH:ubiquinone oxidoreductase subunit 2 (subunit N)